MVILRELDRSSTTNFDSKNNYPDRRSNLATKLHAITQKNGYQFIQTNGQREYAPAASLNIQPPLRGCEVFIGKLHKNIFEDELIPVFESIGPLYKFRLMLDFHEQTRGYAFATYFTKEHADRAVQRLDGYEIRRGLHLGVYKSVDNCRLFIGNVPPQVTRLDMKDLLNRYVDGVVDIIMYMDYVQPHLNRGFVFVEFENHRLAAMARRQFAPENLMAWGQCLYVDWADPLPEVHPKIMAKVSILYLKNLPLDCTSEDLHTVVCNAVGRQIVRKVHKIRDYAFAHFVNRRSAEIAMEKLNGLAIVSKEFGERRIEVEWARPRRFSKKFRLAHPPNNFCMSVPPNIRRMVQQRISNFNTSQPFSNNSTFTNRNDLFYTSFAKQVPGSSSPYHN